MPNKIVLPFSNFNRMVGNSSSGISKFISNQKIGKIELVSKPYKWIIDFQNGIFTKLNNGKKESESNNLSIGDCIGDLLDMISSKNNSYTSVNLFRRTSGLSDFSSVKKQISAEESILIKKNSVTETKLIENKVKTILRKLIKEEIIMVLGKKKP